MLGARATAIVRVLIAARVVGVDIPEPRVRGVVVVAATTREALMSAPTRPPKSRHVPFSAILPT